MNYWWVNHKQTFKQETEGGYIWSPKQNKNNSQNQTYTNLSRTAVGDAVISYADGLIKALGIVTHPHQSADQPEAFGHLGEQWNRDGWLVQVGWSMLQTPIRPKDHLLAIAPLLPTRHYPINTEGRGSQNVYLASVSADLYGVIKSLIQEQNPFIDQNLLEWQQVTDDNTAEAQLQARPIAVTQKEQLIVARRGQGLFRDRVQQLEAACRLTGVSIKDVLVASHIKPWRISSDEEKLDGNNGLLLSPHVDKLFDRGYISFTDEGKILYANDDIWSLMVQWGIDPGRKVGPFRPAQRPYLAYHRESVFIKDR